MGELEIRLPLEPSEKGDALAFSAASAWTAGPEAVVGFGPTLPSVAGDAFLREVFAQHLVRRQALKFASFAGAKGAKGDRLRIVFVREPHLAKRGEEQLEKMALAPHDGDVIDKRRRAAIPPEPPALCGCRTYACASAHVAYSEIASGSR